MIFVARHVLPVTAPPIPGGAVAVRDGRIAAVGPLEHVRDAMPSGTPVRDLGDAALLPGLVNAHAHLELSWMADSGLPAGDYVEWVRALLAQRERGFDLDRARTAAEGQVQLLLRRGTAALADVGNGAWMPAILARSALLGVAFHEIYGFRSADAEPLLRDAASALDRIQSDPEVRDARPRLRVVLTPHAPHTLSLALLKALAGRANAAREPLSIHVAESPAETELVRDGRGPLADLLRERNAWDTSFRALGHSPVQYLDRVGALGARTLAVHCVQLDHQDLSTLQARGVTVVTCPRSNTRLGVGKAPVPKLLASGIPVALGTDSLASAPDLDLFAEMAALREAHPALSPATVLRMATETGARALGLGSDVGAIEPGRLAALVAVGIDPGDDPLEAVTSGPADVAALQIPSSSK